MGQVKWTAKSEKDLDELTDYIAKNFSVDLAIELVNDLIETTEAMLNDNPLCGSILESNPLFSKLIYKGNSIYYSENPRDKNLYVVYVQSRKTQYQKERLVTK